MTTKPNWETLNFDVLRDLTDKDLVNPFDYLEYEEIINIIHEAFEETIDKYAWEFMIIHDLSLCEARNIVIKQLASKW